MINKYLPLFGLTILFFLSSNTLGQKLKIPFSDAGACPFECCTYQEWTVTKETKLLKQMRDNSVIAFTVKKGETVTGVTGVVITTKAGRGKALKDTYLVGFLKGTEREKRIRIKKGQTFSLLTYNGEGVYLIWFKGVFFSVSLNDEGLQEIIPPKSIWWVKIKNKKGRTGWTKLTENFAGMDLCG